MASDSVTVALISDVFIGPDETPRLIDSLKRARSLGAQLVVLPEIPLNSWCPAIETPNEGDAAGIERMRLRDAFIRLEVHLPSLEVEADCEPAKEA